MSWSFVLLWGVWVVNVNVFRELQKHINSHKFGILQSVVVYVSAWFKTTIFLIDVFMKTMHICACKLLLGLFIDVFLVDFQ